MSLPQPSWPQPSGQPVNRAPWPPAAPNPVRSVQLNPSAPPRNGWMTALWIVLGITAAWVVQFLLGALGVGLTVVTGLAALLPLALCFFALRWIDRWDPEPLWLVAIAVGWGAAPSVAIALLLAELFGGGATSAWGELAFAPVTEEIAKGLGLLIIVALARSHIHGLVDGVVYGGLIGAGFAFTENILYFSVALSVGGEEFGATFFGRGVLSPFGHVLFTAMTGAAIGWATERSKGFGGIFGAWCVGLVPAMGLHLAWNALASGMMGMDFYVGYLFTQVPLFLICVGAALLFVRRERRLTAAALSDYQAKGWYTAEEVATLASPAARRSTASWAKARGAGPHFKHVVRTADALSVLRQRQRMNPQDASIAAAQNAMLHQSLTAREALRAAVTPGPGGWTAS